MPITSLKMICGLLLLTTIPLHSDAQILDRVLRRSKQKIERAAEDLLVEKASEAIARKVYKSMSDAFDQMLLDAMKQDSSYSGSDGDSIAVQYGELARTWMERMNESVDLPDQYEFDRRVVVETTDGNDVQEIVMLLSEDEALFGMEQEEKGETRTIIMDLEKDVTVMYVVDKKGDRTAQAIPNIFSLSADMAGHVQDSLEQWTIRKTGKSKEILGYQSHEYEGESQDFETTFYLTEDLDIDWRSSFMGFMEKFMSVQYQEQMDDIKGFLLESHTLHKKKKKDRSSWVTKNIGIEQIIIDNNDYEFGGLQASGAK